MDGVVFIVDAVDRGRFPEAKKELDALLTSEELSNCPFLVLGNKIDKVVASSEDDLRYSLGLQNTYGKVKYIVNYLFMFLLLIFFVDEAYVTFLYQLIITTKGRRKDI